MSDETTEGAYERGRAAGRVEMGAELAKVVWAAWHKLQDLAKDATFKGTERQKGYLKKRMLAQSIRHAALDFDGATRDRFDDEAYGASKATQAIAAYRLSEGHPWADPSASMDPEKAWPDMKEWLGENWTEAPEAPETPQQKRDREQRHMMAEHQLRRGSDREIEA